jgi:RNA polymerase sigma factor (TIGR02999 family)
MLQKTIRRELVWFYPWLVEFSRRLLGGERIGHTLQPTALAHEVIAKLMRWDGEMSDSSNRGLQQLAACMARKALIDSGRRHQTRVKALKRIATEKEQSPALQPATVDKLLMALERLRDFDAELARFVELRYFEGYSRQEAVEILNLSPRTAARKWVFAKAYLAKAMEQD